MILVFSF